MAAPLKRLYRMQAVGTLYSKLLDPLYITQRRHLTDTFLMDRVYQIGVKIQQRQKDKAPLVQARMRDDNGWLVQHKVIVKKQVDIDRTRTIREGCLPAQRQLQAFEMFQ